MKNKKFLAWIFHGKVRKRPTPPPISGVDVEEANNYRFLGITITKNLSRLSCITTLVKKQQQTKKQITQNCLYFFNKLKVKLWWQVLLDYHRGSIETILTRNITNWQGSCTAQDRRALQRVVKNQPEHHGCPSTEHQWRRRNYTLYSSMLFLILMCSLKNSKSTFFGMVHTVDCGLLTTQHNDTVSFGSKF